MRFSTKQVHAGVTPDPVTVSILTPIYQITTHVQDSVVRVPGQRLIVHACGQSNRACAGEETGGAGGQH